MLQIKSVTKKYITGKFVQNALFEVSLNFRQNEFAAVLGPSGSGKTTLLNIIGGLDRYDSGDLVINGTSTKEYKDRDMDTYRNHTIGFVFQSYNLILHQSVLANVELALTISGISAEERKTRARQALDEVGLLEHQHKRPNELSGGQMQRVAIARALINDPDILLADEPTGALDSETSKQVMELLKRVAQDRLVIMVTHDSELAQAYANRIVRLMDGQVLSDSNPHQETVLDELKTESFGKASMSFLTALSLSFNNLRTKMGRTILTAFAGSIGIIGIALILSLSGGVSQYIDDIQKETMISYPITLEAQAIDLAALMSERQEHAQNMQNKVPVSELPDLALVNMGDIKGTSGSRISTSENNLTSFKKYLDEEDAPIHQFIGENGITYSYDISFTVFSKDEDGENIEYEVNTGSGSTFDMMSNMPMGGPTGPSSSSSASQRRAFQEILQGAEGELISSAIIDNYELLAGHWPEKAEDLLIVLSDENKISGSQLYRLGFLPWAEYTDLQKKIDKNEEFVLPEYELSYSDLLDKEFKLLTPAALYQEENGIFKYIGDDEFSKDQLLKDALVIKSVGIVRPKEQAKFTPLTTPFAYTSALSKKLIEQNNVLPVLVKQEENPETNVLTGLDFEALDDQAKIEDTQTYIGNMTISEKASLFNIMQRYGSMNPDSESQVLPDRGNLPSLEGNETAMAAALDRYMLYPDPEVLLRIYDSALTGSSFKDNLNDFGKISFEAPSAINIYSDSFEAKEAIADEINEYNQQAEETDRIVYTDYVALLMSSVTTIIGVISYVLIAFVAVSLVVSSIMIGIITYISVLERTKEIGILRAIGASKNNIAQVFNAETFIIGLFSGLIGVGLTYLILIPGNIIIHKLVNSTDMNAFLSPVEALGLILISVVLTLIGGMIPARLAAKKDPVTALRTE